MQILKKYFWYFILFGGCFAFGILLFLIKRDYLIIHFDLGLSSKSSIIGSIKNGDALRRKVNLFYFKDDKFCSEEKTIVWFLNRTESLKHLLNCWIVFLQEERILDKKSSLQDVSLAKNDEAIISFNRYPFDDQWSIFKKWNFIESMLKTIRNSELNVREVIFLVDHQKMEDDHLDFSQNWPIDGFL